MIPYRLLAPARLEYLEAVRWYRDEVQDRDLGRDFVAKFRQRLERIRRMPRSGALVTGLPVSSHVRRAKLERFPFHVSPPTSLGPTISDITGPQGPTGGAGYVGVRLPAERDAHGATGRA